MKTPIAHTKRAEYQKIGLLDQDLYDQDRKLPERSVSIKRGLKSVTVRVPLALLGSPQRILTSARTFLGEVPLDWTSWRILQLPVPRE